MVSRETATDRKMAILEGMSGIRFDFVAKAIPEVDKGV